MLNELIYRLALTQVPQIGDVHSKILIQQFGDAASVFKAKEKQLEKIEGIGSVRAQAIKSFSDFARAEKEVQFIERYSIKPIFFTDKEYPQRLLNCTDGPAQLFYKGNADLNASKIIAIVGTRSNTEYGKALTEKLIEDLAAQDILIISGLAFGIDAIAHKASVKNGLPTVGVVGHGLDKMYPAVHASLAKEMLENGGGILSEFFSGTQPDKHHFPLRNRIVAGLCDATIVVETVVKGGSMITAKLADSYNRDVFAFPGRTTDLKSSGCNYLIKHNKAMLLTDADQLLQVMGWKEVSKKPKQQRTLFIEMSADERLVFDLLKDRESVAIDEINLKSGLSSSATAAAILSLELQGIVGSLPGKRYKVL